jgi:hypothetical protein
MIQGLIDKLDSFEQVRDAIVAILAAETASQQALATAAGKDPSLWAFSVYAERANPWEAYLESPSQADPVVNVWYESSTANAAASNSIERQDMRGVFNIDCYGYAVSLETAEGHAPGDQAAAFTACRVARLVRNIIQAGQYKHLLARGVVNERTITSVSAFQPPQQNSSMQQILAVRLTLNVRFNEFAPEYQGEPLDYLSLNVLRAEDGSTYFVADYDYTLGD